MSGRMRHRSVRQGLAAVLLGAMLGGATPALAGVGLAVVLDVPRAVKVGESDLEGTLTIISANSEVDEAITNLVFDISLTPSCGSRALSGDCPSGSEDRGVFMIDPIAIGRDGSACGGTVFSVTARDHETGEVTFNAPEGFITLGPVAGLQSARQCIIDFTFSVTAFPTKDSALAAQMPATRQGASETTAHVSAWAMSTGGLRPGVGGNLTTIDVE